MNKEIKVSVAYSGVLDYSFLTLEEFKEKSSEISCSLTNLGKAKDKRVKEAAFYTVSTYPFSELPRYFDWTVYSGKRFTFIVAEDRIEIVTMGNKSKKGISTVIDSKEEREVRMEKVENFLRASFIL